MKSLAMDSSSIISLAVNNLLWILEPLKKKFQGEFYITDSVKQEVITKPLASKRFKLEALTIKEILEENTLSLYQSTELRQESLKLLAIANNIFKSKNDYIKILDLAEVECLALAIILNSNALIVDERTIRLLVEDPYKLSKLLKKKLGKDIKVDTKKLKEFNSRISKINILRSSELIIAAYELKILDKYITNKGFHPELKKDLLDGALWAVKLHGCSITDDEIEEILLHYK